MNQHECKNCGALVTEVEKTCKYCGTANEKHIPQPVLSIFESAQKQLSPTPTKKSGSIFVFILLLIICWPLGIVYALLNFREK